MAGLPLPGARRSPGLPGILLEAFVKLPVFHTVRGMSLLQKILHHRSPECRRGQTLARTDSRVFPTLPVILMNHFISSSESPTRQERWEPADEHTQALGDPHTHLGAAKGGQAPRFLSWKVTGLCSPRGR